MARIGANAKLTYKKEASYNTLITTDTYWRANAENFMPKPDFIEDPALIGSLVPQTHHVAGQSVEATLESPLYADQAGQAFFSILGGEASVANPVLGYVVITYNGAETYLRLSKSTSTITAEKSSNGSSWAVDTAFNTNGTIDVSTASFDTLSELVAAIAGYTGYDCKLFGVGTTASSLLADFSITNLKTNSVNQGAYIMVAAQASASDCKKHTLTPGAATVELPSFTFAVDRGLGTNQTIAYSGMVNKTLTWTNAAKDTEKISLALVGCQETIAQTDVDVAIPTVPPFLVANTKMLIEDSSGNLIEMDEVKNVTLTINPNLDDNRVLNSLYPAMPTRQTLSVELSASLNNTSTQYAARASYLANTTVSIYMFVKTASYANTQYVVPYSMLIRLNAMFLKDFNSPTGNKERYLITMASSSVKPVSTVNTDVIKVEVTDKVTTTY